MIFSFIIYVIYVAKWLINLFVITTICVLTLFYGLAKWIQPEKVMYKGNVKLNGKVALVTGGSSGIGLETARDLAERGAVVVIASNDEKQLEEAAKDIVATTGNQKVFYKFMDLTVFSSIKEFAEYFHKSFDRLDILVNNAGMGTSNPDVTVKMALCNYFGPFFLTNLLLDKLIRSKPSRIVIVSSSAHKIHDLDPDNVEDLLKKRSNFFGILRLYGNTKLCCILWAKALAKRLPANVTVNTVHPGTVMTNIYSEVDKTWSHQLIGWIHKLFFKYPVEGAQTSIYLAVAPEVEGITGEYFFECKVDKPHKITKNDYVVEKLWENTIKYVNVASA